MSNDEKTSIPSEPTVVPVTDWLSQILNDRTTDEPPPEKPEWLGEREYLEQCYESVRNALDEQDEYNQGFEHELNTLAEHGITANVVVSGSLPELTPDQIRERQAYEAEYAAWDERNPERTPLLFTIRKDTPIANFYQKLTVGDHSAPKVTWGWSSLSYDDPTDPSEE